MSELVTVPKPEQLQIDELTERVAALERTIKALETAMKDKALVEAAVLYHRVRESVLAAWPKGQPAPVPPELVSERQARPPLFFIQSLLIGIDQPPNRCSSRRTN
jgi:hypothetical protein